MTQYDAGMAGDAEEGRSAPPLAGLAATLGALRSAVDALRSMGLNEDAAEIERIVTRLAGDAPVRHNVFRRQGDHWVVLYETDVFRLRDSLGMSYLARLLGNAGRELHVLELAGSDPALASDAGPVLDAEARRAYRQRIEELAHEVAEAERRGDLARAAAGTEEIEILTAELSRAEGLGGRERPAASTAERARQAVTKALRSALRRIAVESPALGQHLASTVRTGTYCRYDPDPRLPIAWRL